MSLMRFSGPLYTHSQYNFQSDTEPRRLSPLRGHLRWRTSLLEIPSHCILNRGTERVWSPYQFEMLALAAAAQNLVAAAKAWRLLRRGSLRVRLHSGSHCWQGAECLKRSWNYCRRSWRVVFQSSVTCIRKCIFPAFARAMKRIGNICT